MAMAAEPRRAELPLPGGREGATVKMHPLLCGRMVGPPAMFHRVEGRTGRLKAMGIRVPREEWIDLPVVAFLVEHPGAGPILVDTGFHPAVSVEPKGAMGRMAGLVFKDIRMDPEQSAHAHLRERGIEPSTVGTVVMTHLHSDHASGISEFPGATFVVSEQEWDAASHGKELDGYIKRQYDHGFDWRTIDFERDGNVDSYTTFARTVDLFGDGSVRMLFTPGHTAGHCSVLLRLRGRELLLTADAAYTHRTISETALPFLIEDEHNFKRSLREIQRYIEGAPGAVIIPGHDMAAWRVLDSVYE